jgi:hypothetical protein
MKINIFKNLLKGGTAEVIKEGTKLIDEIFTTKEEKLEAKKELFKLAISDKDSARKMYEFDSTLQKIFAMFFLFAWVFLTVLILNYFVFKKVDLLDWQIAFVSTIYGGISTKLGTIVDFLFGGSSASEKVNLKG